MDKTNFLHKLDEIYRDHDYWFEKDEYIYKPKIKTLYIKSSHLKVYFDYISYKRMKALLNEQGIYKRQVKINGKNTDYYIFRNITKPEPEMINSDDFEQVGSLIEF